MIYNYKLFLVDQFDHSIIMIKAIKMSGNVRYEAETVAAGDCGHGVGDPSLQFTQKPPSLNLPSGQLSTQLPFFIPLPAKIMSTI